MTDQVLIRPLRTVAEYRACVALQRETWGAGFTETVPPAILKIGQMLGGVSAGAFDGTGTLVGFVFGLTGLRDGSLVHWSDMLAVHPNWRGRGLGRRLKTFQRDQVLALGVEAMQWTFDPLQARNAWLNFGRLGAIAAEYVQDMYGETASPLHEGIGTDRLVVTWRLGSSAQEAGEERGRSVRNDPGGGSERVVLAARGEGLPVPEPGHAAPEIPARGLATVSIPSDIGQIMREDPSLARAWREATRVALVPLLAEGWEVCGFVRGPKVGSYRLRPALDPSDREHEG